MEVYGHTVSLIKSIRFMVSPAVKPFSFYLNTFSHALILSHPKSKLAHFWLLFEVIPSIFVCVTVTVMQLPPLPHSCYYSVLKVYLGF